MFTFTPLLGALASSTKASQSILELDGGVKILVDVGWDESFDPSDLAELERQIPTVSLILLTHATPAHIGAFAHCCKTFPLFTQIPIYATSPVIALGRTLLQDLYASSPLAATFLPSTSGTESNGPTEGAEGVPVAENKVLLQPPTGEEIARYFSLIHPLKYSQPHQPLPSPFSPPLNGLTLTAYNAGHTVGGTIWHIQHGMESIVYAVDWNQARENVVAGAAWFGGSGASGAEVIEQLRKPTALVCSSRGGDKLALEGGRKRRDGLLLDMIRSSVAKGGTVLIPTDTSARVLELAYVLEHAWREAAAGPESDNPLKSATLYLTGKKAHGTMRLARSMLEWMDESIVREFEAGDGGDANAGAGAGAGGRSNARNTNQQSRDGADKKNGASKGGGPFAFKHLKIVEKKGKLEKILATKTPQVILASDSSLDWGFSKEVLRQMADGPDNLIILTESFASESDEQGGQRQSRSLGHTLWKWYEERVDGVALEKAADGELLEQVHSGGRELGFTDIQRSPLDANEHLLYQQYLATKRQMRNTAQGLGEANIENTADALDDGSSSSEDSEDSDSEQQGKVLNFSASLAHSNRSKLGLSDEDLGVNILLRRKNVYDYDVRGKKGRERIFPYVAPKKRGDEYGEFIRPEEYLRAEEREEDNQRGPDARAENKLGQKRKWDEIGANGRRLSSGTGKRQHLTQDKDHDDIAADGISLAEDTTVDGMDDGSDGEEEPQEFEGPAKAVWTRTSIHVNARISFIDFTGLHDKRSLEMLIPLIHPRKLILMGGRKSETLALATGCKNLLTTKVGLDTSASSESVVDIFFPAVGDTVDASVDTNAWMVKLSNSLVRRLRWQHVRSLGVVALTGQLKGPEPIVEDEDTTSETAAKKQKMLDGPEPESQQQQLQLAKKETPFPVLDDLPVNMAAATRSVARPLHVGDLRLADLRKLMQAAGHKAEFRGEGTLLIDGFVAVRKSGTGKIEVEGAAQSSLRNPATMAGKEGTFLAVKRKIYEGLAVVAGG